MPAVTYFAGAGRNPPAQPASSGLSRDSGSTHRGPLPPPTRPGQAGYTRRITAEANRINQGLKKDSSKDGRPRRRSGRVQKCPTQPTRRARPVGTRRKSPLPYLLGALLVVMILGTALRKPSQDLYGGQYERLLQVFLDVPQSSPLGYSSLIKPMSDV
jgi:hypothetical protein